MKMLFCISGCLRENSSIPLDTKEFDLLDDLESSTDLFIGRQWLYKDIENVFKSSPDIPGVMIVGEPGTETSALVSNLICSSSSSTLHTNILGYHFCKYSDTSTKPAGKFVKNLAAMIQRRIPEYGYILSNDTFLEELVTEKCMDDPNRCLSTGVLPPLKKTNELKIPWFIVIDALDECLRRNENQVLDLLRYKLSEAPKWLKFIITSRNESKIWSSLRTVKRIYFQSEDSHNLEDIDTYVKIRVYNNLTFFETIREYVNQGISWNVRNLVKQSQGNFLFVKKLLDYWITYNISETNTFPETLGDIYQLNFERLFSDEISFNKARSILEVLVSTLSPVSESDLVTILNIENYRLRKALGKLSQFLRRENNGKMTLFHLSFTEWLTSAENKGEFYIDKKRGHLLLAKFFNSTREENFVIFIQHLILGDLLNESIQDWGNISHILHEWSRTSQSNRSLLHFVAATSNSVTLKNILPLFNSPDLLDTNGFTPAFLATTFGLSKMFSYWLKVVPRLII